MYPQMLFNMSSLNYYYYYYFFLRERSLITLLDKILCAAAIYYDIHTKDIKTYKLTTVHTYIWLKSVLLENQLRNTVAANLTKLLHTLRKKCA